jgi:hypothetical protein
MKLIECNQNGRNLGKKKPRTEINRSGDSPFLSLDHMRVCSTPIEIKPLIQAGLLTVGSLY